MKIIIIAAVAKNGVIGKNGSIPWHSKAELQHFKKTTMGFPIIMGRKTWESIGRVLPGRLNIVLTSKEFKPESENLIYLDSLEKALEFCRSKKYEKCFIIGGSQIYKSAINSADCMIITRMPFEIEGDSYFPHIGSEWNLITTNNLEEFSIEEYTRVSI